MKLACAGAVITAALSAPAAAAARLLGFGKLSGLYIMRSVLVRPHQHLACPHSMLLCRIWTSIHEALENPQGCGVAAALLVLRSAIERTLGRRVGIAFVALTATQFHLPFYASRPLANTFALIPTA